MITTTSLSEQLDIWYQQEPGRSLLDAETRAIHHLLKRLFGYHLVQINGPNFIDLLVSSSILHKIRIDNEISASFGGSQVKANPMELPLVPKSVDVIFLPHLLEFCDKPEQLLQAIYKALIPGGRVVILGFNPMSLWGLSNQWRKRLPGLKKLLFFGQLSKLGFALESYQTIFYRPSLLSSQLLQRYMFLEAIGPLCWPSFGATYIVVAQKVKSAVTLIQAPSFKKSNGKVKATIPEVTTKM